MEKNILKYIEAIFWGLILSIFVGLKINKDYGYLVNFTLGKFFYLFLLYFLIKIFVSFVENKALKEIFRTRLNASIIFMALLENLFIILSMKEYNYQDFFVTAIEKFHSGAFFVSLFSKLYKFVPKALMLTMLAVLLSFLTLYVFGKLIGFFIKVIKRYKNGTYRVLKEKKKADKERIKAAKLEEKEIKKRNKIRNKIEKEEIVPSYEEEQGDFLIDIKKEFKTIFHAKDKNENKEKTIDEEQRKRIHDEMIKRQELRKTNRVNAGPTEDEDETEITFIRATEEIHENVENENTYKEQQLFENNNKEEEQTVLKNYKQQNLVYSTSEQEELAKTLAVPVSYVLRAFELIHTNGLKDSSVLVKEFGVDSDEAERIYTRVKKLKEYK